MWYVTRLPISDELPASWLEAGADDRGDVVAAAEFRQLLQTRLTKVPFVISQDAGHQASAWRAALGPMPAWMTSQLAAQAADAAAASVANAER